MISGATTLKVIFGEYYFALWYTSTVDSLSSLWIATGCFLLALSIFGIAAAVKESTFMTNFVSSHNPSNLTSCFESYIIFSMAFFFP